MIEVEVKLPIASEEGLPDKLTKLGYVREKILQEEDVYFNGPDHDLKKNDEALRVRRQAVFNEGGEILKEQSFVTYKGQKLDTVSMARKELETNVSDGAVMKEIWISLGYKPMRPVIKLREEYKKDNITCCLDRVEGLGFFLELEVCVPDESGREKALSLIENELTALGYSMEDTTRISYLSMLEMLDA